MKPPESDLTTIEPGEELRSGTMHAYRLTAGHLVSSEPMKKLGLGRAAAEVRATEREVAAAYGASGTMMLRTYLNLRRCGARHCARGCYAGWRGIFATCGCAGREDYAVDPGEPTKGELKDAGFKGESKPRRKPIETKIESESKTETDTAEAGDEPGEADAGGLSSWFGTRWGDDNDDDDDDEGGYSGEGEYGSQRRLAKKGRMQDPMLVKLRFRRYADHVISYS